MTGLREAGGNAYADAMNIVYTTVSLAFQSLFYGIYLILMPCTVRILLRKGTKSRTNRGMLAAIFFPFVLSSLYWILEVAQQVFRIEHNLLHPEKSNDDPRLLNFYTTLFNAIILLNYIFTDGVVVWRAWALCRQDYPRLLVIPVVFLSFTAVSVFATIAIRSATFLPAIHSNRSTHEVMIRTLDYLQVSNLVWSLLTNITATLIITHKTWRYRVLIYDDLKHARGQGTRAERVLAVLVETGVLYCISGATVLIATLIRMPGSGTLGDIYTPINVQIAGIYPTIVIVVVALERSLNKTTFWQQSITAGAEEQRHPSAQLATRIPVSSPQSPRSRIHFTRGLESEHDEIQGSMMSARGAKPHGDVV